MGIHGLLPLLKSIMVPLHIKDLKGLYVAVDTYSWLHKGALSCSKELCKGEPTTRHVDYCMHRVNLLRHYGVKPILVFDGGFLPMKGEQENKRARARKEALERATEHESTGNSAAAYECYQKAVDISPSIAYKLIQVLKQEDIDYIVAPYEADAQMTFLALSKRVDAVITEDSDLIPFGCPRIIFKMDKFGQGVEFRYSMLEQNKELNFSGFNKQMVLEMCILSGCDYLQSLPGMGLKKAHALIRKFKSYEKVIKHLRYNTASVPPLYEDLVKKAILTFQHQRVYDPRLQDMVHLSEIPNNLGDDLHFLGPLMPQDMAKGIAEGDLDPLTKMPFQEIVRVGLVLDKTYLLKNFKSDCERRKLDLPAQKNVLTNYFCNASLEAKKKFKAPRIMSKHLDSMEKSSPSFGEHASDSPFALTLSCSSESNCDSENLDSTLPPKESVEEGFVINGNQLASLSHGLNNEKDVVGNRRTSGLTVSLQQSSLSLCKPCVAHKERDCKSTPAVEGKTRLVSKKVIVRSSYFKHKIMDENDFADKNVKFFAGDTHNGVNDDRSCGSVSSGYNCLEESIGKRKSIPIDSTETESAEVKYTQPHASLPRKSDSVTGFASKFMKVGSEKKFGCNISHLSDYSDIAEKSMENFVSVMSSFRCKSSGSRASGLRAPFRDVQNTCETRSTTASMDLSRFSYVPKNQKTASASHRN
ncbi:exonuclease 1 isoform X2 [Macadamia integrifolia]|uniref:exonuclease 1 isoform X2 n=1 Tax=Macadamia integrifolia TaxID=60698 RepID=UPI001C4E653B|nr:exonuclease 1 isoform X2 [Macadamia integrifolia]